MTRYVLLRESVAYFASTADEQLAHDWGADDAVCDIPYPLEHMLERKELSSEEVAILRPFQELISQYCSRPGDKPWDDKALLSSDPDWARIRSTAAEILSKLPEEIRGGA